MFWEKSHPGDRAPAARHFVLNDGDHQVVAEHRILGQPIGRKEGAPDIPPVASRHQNPILVVLDAVHPPGNAHAAHDAVGTGLHVLAVQVSPVRRDIVSLQPDIIPKEPGSLAASCGAKGNHIIAMAKNLVVGKIGFGNAATD